MAVPLTDVDDQLRHLVESGKECNVLVYGLSGIGKSSLVGALLSGKSTGVGGPDPGTSDVVCRQYKGKHNIPINIYDTPGLNLCNADAVIKEIRRKCHPNKMACVIACFDFFQRFDKKLLKHLFLLDCQIWRKMIIVLTKCDQIPPEINQLEQQEKVAKIAEIRQSWISNFEEAMRDVLVDEAIIGNLSRSFALSMHTDIEKDQQWEIWGEANDYKSTNRIEQLIRKSFIDRFSKTSGEHDLSIFLFGLASGAIHVEQLDFDLVVCISGRKIALTKLKLADLKIHFKFIDN